MPSSSVRSAITNVCSVSFRNPISFSGFNNYKLDTGILMWDEHNSYRLDSLIPTFGNAVASPGIHHTVFTCGESTVPSYDFGLLFSMFTAAVAAYTEQGVSVHTSSDETDILNLDVAWYNCYAVLYSKELNQIIPIKSTEIQSACRRHKVEVDSFSTPDKFTLTRQGFYFIMSKEDGSAFCKFKIPVYVQRAFPILFDGDPSNDELVDDPDTPWDERSELGAIIAGTMSSSGAEQLAIQYRDKISLESVVVREDLVFTPTKRYANVKELFGSIAYTDKKRIVLAVEFRNELFVFQPWFNGDLPSTIEVDANPDFQEFYNVTEEAKTIERFANSISIVPPTAAQFDVAMFSTIKDKFYELELTMVNFKSSFGRIVIPEKVLLSGLSSEAGETVYAIVPVGCIGSTVLCKTSEGNIVSMSGMPWSIDEPFYDVTEVVRSALC